MNTAIQTHNVANGRTIGGVHGLRPSQLIVPFDIEDLQHLSAEEALQCQMMLGHGSTLGQWETPPSMSPHIRAWARKVNLNTRIKASLPANLLSHPGLDAMMAEAVLYLTRWALMCRLGPVGNGPNAHGSALDVTTIAQTLYKTMSRIVGLGVKHRLTSSLQSTDGFVAPLPPEVLRPLYDNEQTNNELNRMRRLVAIGLWFDEPAQVQFRSNVTSVTGPREMPKPERKRGRYQPLPDWYVAQIGPRVLWLIKDLGPNLLHVLRYFLCVQKEKRFKTSESLSRHLTEYFAANVLLDRNGKMLEPPFDLRLSALGKGQNPDRAAHAWPPRDFADVMSLAATLQRAHLFMALLLMAARHGEVLTLDRDCVKVDDDGQVRIQGKTYKATEIVEGKDRKWPAPTILVHAFAQQNELMQVMEELETLLDETITRRVRSGLEDDSRSDDTTPLWGVFTPAGTTAAAALDTLDRVLPKLAQDVGVDERPDGIRIHPHRLRKTMARLAGIAIDGSQKVLMQLLGHEDVGTTLYYMQSDLAFKQEMEDVIREVRILRMDATIESVRAAMHAPDRLPNGGLGGGGANVLTQTIVKHEEWLHRQGKEWGAGDARELATLLADNGRAARLIAPGVVCTKSTHERGLCNSRMGEVSPGNCKVECHSHIELALGRRDVQRVIPILVQHTATSIENGEWLSAIHHRKQLTHEMSRFADIGDEWRAKPEVQRLLDHDLESGE